MSRWNDKAKRAELYKKCIARWGAKNRVAKTAEESAELSASCVRFLLNPKGHTKTENKDGLLAELADVRIMSDQMLLLFAGERDSCNRSLEQIIDEKLDRLQSFVEEEDDGRRA